jgi:hypothetical protein
VIGSRDLECPVTALWRVCVCVCVLLAVVFAGSFEGVHDDADAASAAEDNDDDDDLMHDGAFMIRFL